MSRSGGRWPPPPRGKVVVGIATVFSDLSLRIIMHGGRERGHGAVADELNASRAHVAKVVTRLVESTWSAVKGRMGIYLPMGRGARWGDPARARGWRSWIAWAPIARCCRVPLRTALADAQEAFFAHLDPIVGELGPPGSPALPDARRPRRGPGLRGGRRVWGAVAVIPAVFGAGTETAPRENNTQ